MAIKQKLIDCNYYLIINVYEPFILTFVSNKLKYDDYNE